MHTWHFQCTCSRNENSGLNSDYSQILNAFQFSVIGQPSSKASAQSQFAADAILPAFGAIVTMTPIRNPWYPAFHKATTILFAERPFLFTCRMEIVLESEWRRGRALIWL